MRRMNIPDLIQTYGYFAVFIGTLLEGETVLLLAGYAAHQGLLNPYLVFLVAWLGATLGDQFYFWLGRRHGQGLMQRFPKLHGKIERALHLIENHPRKAIFSMRFIWGLRAAMPIALGLSRVSWPLFIVLNIISALVWAALITSLGFMFGAALSAWLGEMHHYEHWIVLALVLLALFTWHIYRNRNKAKS
jgi:membrane protein DedA with SNARE-associated domain